MEILIGAWLALVMLMIVVGVIVFGGALGIFTLIVAAVGGALGYWFLP